MVSAIKSSGACYFAFANVLNGSVTLILICSPLLNGFLSTIMKKQIQLSKMSKLPAKKSSLRKDHSTMIDSIGREDYDGP